ncbi:MAG: hypothetical protein HY390_04015 [Deltaproteobacteria bacterium]|nr:hypothetical protein [Deltaproteobacteria bacterium]
MKFRLLINAQIISHLLAPLLLFFFIFPCSKVFSKEGAVYYVRYTVTFPAFSSEDQSISIWIPTPLDSAEQKMERILYDTPWRGKWIQSEHTNHKLYFEGKTIRAPLTLSLHYRLSYEGVLDRTSSEQVPPMPDLLFGTTPDEKFKLEQKKGTLSSIPKPQVQVDGSEYFDYEVLVTYEVLKSK